MDLAAHFHVELALPNAPWFEILGQAGTTTYIHTNAAGAGPFFYRVGVNCP